MRWRRKLDIWARAIGWTSFNVSFEKLGEEKLRKSLILKTQTIFKVKTSVHFAANLLWGIQDNNDGICSSMSLQEMGYLILTRFWWSTKIRVKRLDIFKSWMFLSKIVTLLDGGASCKVYVYYFVYTMHLPKQISSHSLLLTLSLSGSFLFIHGFRNFLHISNFKNYHHAL